MSKASTRIKLDVFSLNWLGDNPKKSRSAGMMSISYNEVLNEVKMREILSELFSEYKFFCCNLEYEHSNYYFSIPDEITEEEITNKFHFIEDKSRDELFHELQMKEINLFEDDLYQIYFLKHPESFDIVIFGSHLIGDGLTSATALSIVLNNYYAAINGFDTKIFPKVEYKQLLNYAYTMKYNRFGKILWVPRWFRFIPGYLSYRSTTKFDVPDQIFDGPVPLDEPLLRSRVELSQPFNKLLALLKEQRSINSNHLIVSLISFAHLDSHNYDRSIATYPINIRNKYGFEAGNLLTVNRIEIRRGKTFLEHLELVVELLEREKNKSGPYYAISLGKFVRNDYEVVKERMSKVVHQSNLRFSNVGGLPAPNLDTLDEEQFKNIPVSDYYANALPLGAIGVHFFISSLENAYLKHYYLTILHSKDTENNVKQVIDHIRATISDVYLKLTSD